MSIKIYGKTNCVHCDNAKSLLDRMNVPYEYTLVETPEAKQMLFEAVSPHIRTVPVVVVDGVWIGGYTELYSYINENYSLTNGQFKENLNG
jgi:glutaredoxin 3